MVIGLSEEPDASMMADLMSEAVKVAHETFQVTKGGPVPTRRYLKRQHAKTHNCLDEYWACLTQAIAAYERRTNPETDEWLEDVVRFDTRTESPYAKKQQLPDVPTCTEKTEWQRWTAECAKQKVQTKEDAKS